MSIERERDGGDGRGRRSLSTGLGRDGMGWDGGEEMSSGRMLQVRSRSTLLSLDSPAARVRVCP